VPQVSLNETVPLAGGFPPAFFSETQIMSTKTLSHAARPDWQRLLRYGSSSLAYLPLASIAYRVAFIDDLPLMDEQRGALASPCDNDVSGVSRTKRAAG
jgi:hypothetical protein